MLIDSTSRLKTTILIANIARCVADFMLKAHLQEMHLHRNDQGSELDALKSNEPCAY